MTLSIAVVAKADDQLIADRLEQFLRNEYEGIRVIFFTRSEDKQFYIIDKDSFNKNRRGNEQS